MNEVAGIIAGPRVGSASPPDSFEWFDASHPSPDAASEAAGRRALTLAVDSRARGGLLVLLSGGASALMAVPADGLTLADKMLTARVLMNAGAPIADLNCVRKHLSAIKGGRLAAAAGRTVTLAISDVHGPIPDDPAVIGSGPTVGDPTTYADALGIVERAGVKDSIPRRALEHLERGADESPKPGDPRLQDCDYEVIGNRQMAVEGAARAAREPWLRGSRFSGGHERRGARGRRRFCGRVVAAGCRHTSVRHRIWRNDRARAWSWTWRSQPGVCAWRAATD